jgi:hypothetical protein
VVFIQQNRSLYSNRFLAGMEQRHSNPSKMMKQHYRRDNNSKKNAAGIEPDAENAVNDINNVIRNKIEQNKLKIDSARNTASASGV